MDNLHFLPNNILTRLFKELKKKKTINNIPFKYLHVYAQGYKLIFINNGALGWY